MAASNGAWIQKALPDAEALAMKEDLVVWPPTVILYNSSITTSNSDDRVIVSVEEVEAFIKGKLPLPMTVVDNVLVISNYCFW